MLQRLAGVIACALALTLGAATTAQAATLTQIDGPGDVWLGDGLAVDNPRRLSGHEQGDILRTVFTHAQRQLEIRTRFAELDRQTGGTIQLNAKLRTNTGAVSLLNVRTGFQSDWRVLTSLVTDRGDRIDCAISPTIDYARDVALIRLPRTCLNNPRTVQVSFLVTTGSFRHPFLDNPINHHDSTRRCCSDGMPPYTARIPVG